MAKGSLLSLLTKVQSDIFEGFAGGKKGTTQHFQAMNIIKEDAVALVRGQQCLCEKGAHTGCFIVGGSTTLRST